MIPYAVTYWILSRTYFHPSYSSLICINKKIRIALQTDDKAICRQIFPTNSTVVKSENTIWRLTTANTTFIHLWLWLLVKGLYKLSQVHDLSKTLCWVHVDELIQIMCTCWKIQQNYVICLVWTGA